MNMKRVAAILGLLAVAAIVVLVVVVAQNIDTTKQLNALNEQAASLQTQMDQAAKSAAAELESVKADAARELENANAAAEEAAQADAQALEQAQADAAQELARVQAALQAAEEKTAQTESELSEALQKTEELAAAKEAAESEASQAKEQLELILKAVSSIMNGSAKEENVPIAMLYYESADHTVRAYSQDFTDGVTASVKDIQGEGTYTVGLTFDAPAEGLYFMTLAIESGETRHPGWVIDVKEVKVNGQPIALGQVYTTSDDGLRTRVNLFNDWVKALPEDARGVEADLRDATPTPVNPEDFAAVEAIEVTFDYLSPETVAARQAENP